MEVNYLTHKYTVIESQLLSLTSEIMLTVDREVWLVTIQEEFAWVCREKQHKAHGTPWVSMWVELKLLQRCPSPCLTLHFFPSRPSCRTVFIPPWCNAHRGPWLHLSKNSSTIVDPATPLPTTTPWWPRTWSWRTCWRFTSRSPSTSLGKRSFRGCH